MKPTITSRRPRATSASRICSHSGVVEAHGFSHMTGLPAAMQASVELGVGLADRRDEDRIDLIGRDQRVAVGKHLRAAQVRGDPRGSRTVDVGDGADGGPGDAVLELGGVVGADHACPDHADANGHQGLPSDPQKSRLNAARNRSTATSSLPLANNSSPTTPW